jgi:hypothetical protein
VNTLVLLELTPGTEREYELKVLVRAQIRRRCPEENCLVASYAPGSEATQFVDLVKEVDQRAHDTMVTSAAKDRGVERCVYVAVRIVPFSVEGDEPYELGVLFIVFRARDHVVRRYTVPDFDDETPAYVVAALDEDVQKAQGAVTVALAEQSEEVIVDSLADAIIDGFADFNELLFARHN